jgi:hypothetical protein
MMHPNRCANGCKMFTNHRENFPAGSCTQKGIILKLTPERKRWIEIVGCASFDNGILLGHCPDCNNQTVVVDRSQHGYTSFECPCGYKGRASS